MSEPETEEIWICRKCGRKIDRKVYSGKMPAKCPKCGGVMVKKVVVR